jgi:hypothetical protein
MECLPWKGDLRPRLVFMKAKVNVNWQGHTGIYTAEGENLVNLPYHGVPFLD